jgi:hypothetical protein
LFTGRGFGRAIIKKEAKMRRKGMITILAMVLLVAGWCGVGWAKDTVRAEVTESEAIVTPNGLAEGTIHVVYTVNAWAFTPGFFNSFDLSLDIAARSGSPETAYPLTLNLTQKQSGDASLELTPTTANFGVNGPGAVGSTGVTVTIPSGAPDADETTLTGVLQLEASPGSGNNAHLDTITTIVVKVILMHPTACLKVVDFITDQDFTRMLATATASTPIEVKVKNGNIQNTNPPQLSDNILIANNCGDAQTFDLQIALDSRFETSPARNPGNAVFTYQTTGIYEEPTTSLDSFGAGTPQGQQLCLGNVTVPAGQTFLATVHMRIGSNVTTALPEDGTFDFLAAVWETDPTACSSGTYLWLAGPNPAPVQLPFTVTVQGNSK